MVIDIRCHGVQSRHLPPPSPEVEFTAQSQSRTPIRACSGWPQHSGGNSKTLATAEAHADADISGNTIRTHTLPKSELIQRFAAL
jgi:hypothetical protein